MVCFTLTVITNVKLVFLSLSSFLDVRIAPVDPFIMKGRPVKKNDKFKNMLSCTAGILLLLVFKVVKPLSLPDPTSMKKIMHRM